MTEKIYKIGENEYTIKGSDSLHEFIGKLQGQAVELQTKLDSTPKFGEQWELWKKAEPFFQGKKNIDYNMSTLDVMKTSLEIAGYDVTDIDENTTRYMFNKVLKVPESSSDSGESGSKSTNNSATNTNTQAKPSKPNVKEPASATGVTPEELGDAWLSRRISGELVSNTNNSGNNSSN
jgi:hypothetical protein